MADRNKKSTKPDIRKQSREMRDLMGLFVRGFVLHDPRKSYPNFYLTPQQSYVLTTVKKEKNITPGEVARVLNLEKSHLTKIVNTLIELDALEKIQDEKDKRCQILSLTEKGEEIYSELEKASGESFRKFMELIPEGKRTSVLEGMRTMLDAMEELRALRKQGK